MNSWSSQKRFIEIEGIQIAYVEMGQGRPIIFQHGNPTSSYLWRNILPKLKDLGRCIAIDLIGMGDSDKLPQSGPLSYTFVEHRKYWEKTLDALGISEDIIFVIHDWGSALGFDYIARHQERVSGVCHMEGIVMPLTWEQWPDSATNIFRVFRSSAGEEVVLEKNVFVERVLPASIIRELEKEELEAYVEPFKNPGEDRRPTLSWPRQIPLDGEPKEVVSIVQNYSEALSKSSIPKLLIRAEPGMIMNGEPLAHARTWVNHSEVTVKGLHFIQEDSPGEIVSAIRSWTTSLPK